MPHNTAIRIFLFGDVHIKSGGEIFRLPQRESLIRLFVYLLLQSNQLLSRRTLAFSLWPDETEPNALANLRRHLYLLRKVLPKKLGDFLIINQQSVLWSFSNDYWIDVFSFQKNHETIEELEQAASLYRNELAQGLNEDEFIFFWREELRRKYLEILKRLAEHWQKEGDYERAAQWAYKLISLNLWDEESIRMAMRIETLKGDRSSAISIYKKLTKELEEQLRTQPMPETMALYTDIINNRILLVPPEKKELEKTNFIARESEIKKIVNLLEGLSASQGGVAIISGEAGIGKSFLIQEALNRFVHKDNKQLQIFWGYCQSPHINNMGNTPYTVWKQIISAVTPLLAHSQDFPTEWLSHLVPLIPDLHLLRPNLLPPSLPDTSSLHSAIKHSLSFLSSKKPLLIIIEDAHWADINSLELLTQLIDFCHFLPILFLITQRSNDLSFPLLQAKQTIRQYRALVELQLERFNKNEIKKYLGKFFEEKDINDDFLEEINQYTHGLPLFLHEAVELLSNTINISDYKNASPSLKEALTYRLNQLSQQARKMIEVAAILGFTFRDIELQTVLAWEKNTYVTILDNLLSLHFFKKVDGSEMGDYSFSHQAIHEIILSDISSQNIQIIHKQVAQCLEKVYFSQNGYALQIASHYLSAGVMISAARFWLKHAEEITHLSAFQQALEAIQLAESLLDKEIFEQREIAAQAALQRLTIAYYQGSIKDESVFIEVLNHTREFPVLYARALIIQGYALYTQDKYQQAKSVAENIINLAQAIADAEMKVHALNIRGISALMLGETQLTINDLERALRLLNENKLDISEQMVQSLNHLGTALVFSQKYVRANEIFIETINMANKGGLRRLEAAALTMQGQIKLNCGNYKEAIQTYSQAMEIAGNSYLPGMWGKFAGRGQSYLRLGEIQNARSDFQEGLKIAKQVNSKYGQLLMEIYLISTQLANQDSKESLPTLAFIESIAKEKQIQPILYLLNDLKGQMWRGLRQLEKSQLAYQQSLLAAQSTNVPTFILNANIQLSYIQLLISNSQKEPLKVLKKSIEDARSIGEIPTLARGLLVKGHIHWITHQTNEALSTLQEGLTFARSCPDQGLIAEGLILLSDIYTKLKQQETATLIRNEARVVINKFYAFGHILLDTSSKEGFEIEKLALGLLGE